MELLPPLRIFFMSLRVDRLASGTCCGGGGAPIGCCPGARAGGGAPCNVVLRSSADVNAGTYCSGVWRGVPWGNRVDCERAFLWGFFCCCWGDRRSKAGDTCCCCCCCCCCGGGGGCCCCCCCGGGGGCCCCCGLPAATTRLGLFGLFPPPPLAGLAKMGTPCRGASAGCCGCSSCDCWGLEVAKDSLENAAGLVDEADEGP